LDRGPIRPKRVVMAWLKRTISILLLAAAVAVALATAFSNHSDDYGKVPLPQGGAVHLPQGKVVVFYSQPADASDQVSVPFRFQVVPAAGGSPVSASSANGAASGITGERSQTIGELGAVAKLKVPSAGEYVVSASANLPPGAASLEFGTSAEDAVLQRWHLLAGLVIAAFLIALIPVPRSRRRRRDEAGAPSGWSSDPRAPYVG
jgi:hypothetical protein